MTRRSKIEDLTQEQYSDLVARLYAAQDGWPNLSVLQ